MKQPSLLSSILGAKVQVDVTKTEAYLALFTEFEAYKTQASEVLALADAKVTELSATNESLTAQLAAIADLVAEKELAEAARAEQAKADRLAVRREKIEAAVGDSVADALLSATTEMDEESFARFVTALTLTVDNEAKSPLFKEAGVAAEVDPSKAVAISDEMKLLQDKYGTR